MKISIYHYSLISIKFYHVLLISSVITLFAILYATTTSEPISAEILEEIKSHLPTNKYHLEKNRIEISFMEERGWYFIILGAMVLSIAIWIILSNHRTTRACFLGYSYRIKDGLIQAKSKTLTFQQRLLDKCKVLTFNDLLIAEMLVNGLSTKQIALELNISPSSANTARYRLRKKMNLSSETDLIMFLQAI